MADRPSWEEYFVALAEVAASRADCTRRRVGCVIASADNRVISTGYNGAPSGQPGCLTKKACERGRHFRQSNTGLKGEINLWCACGGEWPCTDSATPGRGYRSAAPCTAVHAEANALDYVTTPHLLAGATAYVVALDGASGEPCEDCRALLARSPLFQVRWRAGSGELHQWTLNRGARLLG